ncbi:phosphate/phosphite/phosphonate ABC transporter substrate-binding protein [Stappia sp. 28M-7]|uniref:phosphate/phosphite/phosphonate ABC transporter substrate-binding protein n=1 Tax=Stappia sp. 28M-7 TaxID=2762596 RepID=UPI00163C2B91|nr:PhnD/SsuA/transferrin family substrate-binding protein [Stappia sp. 28M-7]MBC2860596.1 PhnD/SsuA/transferrin family substrate-binding protein [Stappia sp. 28M-7]
MPHTTPSPDSSEIFAFLPMYDWPEVRTQTDRLWSLLCQAFADLGLGAPQQLERGRELMDGWQDPSLLLGQTCGLPLVRHLLDRVCVLGSPDYGLPDCPPGHYCSVVVVREEDPAASLAELRGRRLAYNHPGSQSGEGALRHVLAPIAEGKAFFSSVMETGSHRAALKAVAAGEADAATLDAMSYRLAQAHEPAARSVRVLLATPPTPGLPMITARGNRDKVPMLRQAAAAAIAAAPQDLRTALSLHGFAAFDADDYKVIAERDRHAAALGYPVLA